MTIKIIKPDRKQFEMEEQLDDLINEETRYPDMRLTNFWMTKIFCPNCFANNKVKVKRGYTLEEWVIMKRLSCKNCDNLLTVEK